MLTNLSFKTRPIPDVQNKKDTFNVNVFEDSEIWRPRHTIVLQPLGVLPVLLSLLCLSTAGQALHRLGLQLLPN
jgi:hypothetical protein